jgi:hypothetical protein
MFTVCAAEKMQEEDIPRLREEIAKGKNFGIKQYYGDAMMNTATPGRLVHMQQCIDNQDVLL